MEMSRDNEKMNNSMRISNEMQLQNHSLTFIHKKITSFSSQHSLLFTHCVQHYCFLGQANLYRLCGLWQMSREKLTTFLVRIRFQLFGCKTQSVQQKRQQRVSTGPISYNRRNRFQPVFAIEESAGQCSQKFCKRGNFEASAETYNVQRHG